MGFIYQQNKNKGQLMTVLFDSWSSINVVPITLIKSINAKNNPLREDEET